MAIWVRNVMFLTLLSYNHSEYMPTTIAWNYAFGATLVELRATVVKLWV